MNGVCSTVYYSEVHQRIVAENLRMMEDCNNDQKKEPLTEKTLIMYLSQMRNSLDIEMGKIQADKRSNNCTISQKGIEDFLEPDYLKMLEDFYIRNGDLTKEPLTEKEFNQFLFQLKTAMRKDSEDFNAFCKAKMKEKIEVPKLEGNAAAVMEAAIVFLAAESRFLKFLCGGEFTYLNPTSVGMLLMQIDYQILCPKVFAMWEKYKDFWPIKDMNTLRSLLRYACGDRMNTTCWESETYVIMSVATVQKIFSAPLILQMDGLKPIPPHLIEHVIKLHKLTATDCTTTDR